ncbi:hypothetical protein [Rhizobium sp. FY34]|uniref:hypothetical protein n=1 Tax=Rhizobium sp. FY34 TaxID=2562309 RepID=UPI0010BF9CBA|nr:hypothetical protein [Rhizobium sp. FY34]
MAALSTKDLDNFHKAAISLKLFSRAELNDDKNRSLIEKLYVDPLPNDHVFKTLLADNTTFIIGRKGSGKSTVFQRVQHEIRKNKSNIISAYMDIRNVFEASQIDPVAQTKIEALDVAMSPDQIQRFLLYKRFLRLLISDIRNELKSQVDQSFLTRLRERVSGTSAEVFAGLDLLITKLDNPDYEDIAGIVSKQIKKNNSARHDSKATGSVNFEVSSTDVAIGVGVGAEVSKLGEHADEELYTQILMRIIGINDIISEIQKILGALGIKRLYIFLDDFSELPQQALHLLVDALISPLARWSDFIKFKIAAYPGRVYLGSLDKTKIEEIQLDMYGLYGGSGVAKMEEKAIDFVQRLVEKRIQHFCKVDAEVFLNVKLNEFWRTLFHACMANPRILGHLMLYAYDAQLIYQKKVGIQAVQEASQRYYEEKIAPFFATGKYKLALEERSSIYSLKELLEKIVSRARAIRQEGSRDASNTRSRPFASHFYVSHEFDELLLSLETSFFLTKYFEQSDREGVRVSIYALNYGLCTKYQIGFGRPTERREDRLYFVDRKFDYNALARSYIQENQEIKCSECNSEYDLSMLPALKMLHMSCPKCRKGICAVVNLSQKYGDVIEAIGPELLLPETELGIMQTLYSEKKPMVAAEIAGDLDCSGQLVGRRGKNLAERKLVERTSSGQVYSYTLTEQAKSAYFSDPTAGDLDIADSG